MNRTERIKGETTAPSSTLALLAKIGVTRASKALGTSTTTLHKARKSGTVSKVVEVAASHVLEHLGDTAPRTPKEKATALFLLEVEREKAPLVERFAEALHAELVAA